MLSRFVLFRARERLCALPIEHVIEAMRPLPIEPLREMPAPVRGLSMIRGAPVPVVDVGALVRDGSPADTRRFLLLRLGAGRRVALAVEDLAGVRDLPRDTLASLPPLLGGVRGDGVEAVGTLDGELLVVLRAGRVVPDAAWAAIESRSGAG